MLPSPNKKIRSCFNDYIFKGNKNVLYTILVAIILFSWIYMKLFAHYFLKSTIKIDYDLNNMDRLPKLIDLDYPIPKPRNKQILIWDSEKDLHKTPFKRGTKLFNNCLINLCEITTDESMMPTEYYDAIVINAQKKLTRLPTFRRKQQVYIFYTESLPADTVIHKNYEKPLINLTMTYRTDSDIFYPTAQFVPDNTAYVTAKRKVKVKTMIWFDDIDFVTKNMAEIVKQLRNYIDINIRFTKSKNLTVSNYSKIVNNYKFILIFQKQDCIDYISEEVYKMLHYDIVPVVFGLTLSRNLLPEKSVIFGEDYHNPQTLATYLKYLKENEEEYLLYFDWKKEYIIDYSREDSYCQLCRYLNAIDIPKKFYYNVKDWWYNMDICTHMYAFALEY